jgi:hypothetical protein
VIPNDSKQHAASVAARAAVPELQPPAAASVSAGGPWHPRHPRQHPGAADGWLGSQAKELGAEQELVGALAKLANWPKQSIKNIKKHQETSKYTVSKKITGYHR